MEEFPRLVLASVLNKRPRTSNSGKVCLLASATLKRQTLPEKKSTRLSIQNTRVYKLSVILTALDYKPQ
jgi:hypothetical protein